MLKFLEQSLRLVRICKSNSHIGSRYFFETSYALVVLTSIGKIPSYMGDASSNLAERPNKYTYYVISSSLLLERELKRHSFIAWRFFIASRWSVQVHHRESEAYSLSRAKSPLLVDTPDYRYLFAPGHRRAPCSFQKRISQIKLCQIQARWQEKKKAPAIHHKTHNRRIHRLQSKSDGVLKVLLPNRLEQT